MDNGCICCTVRGDLVRTLNSLVARRKDFHAIVLETTGLVPDSSCSARSAPPPPKKKLNYTHTQSTRTI
jgi:G3E family GTPase